MPDGPHVEEQDFDELSLARGCRIGEFELTGIIGKGGFGIVYLAWDHSLDRVVALKEYMPASLASRKNHTHVNPRSERHRDTYEAGLRSFVNEAKLLAQFDSPALVKVHRFWEANGTAYMAMPYYRGATLAQTIRALAGPPQEEWLMELLAPLTEALMELHAAQCYHRDVAPDNILILEDSGLPLLLDFGAARRVIADQTQALTVILKAGYAPIEQYAEVPGLQQGAWTDVYALASVVYWSVTGRTPPPAIGRMIRDSYVPLVECAPPHYSDRFAPAIDRALILMPAERTDSIASFRANLGLSPYAVSRTSRAVQWSDPDRTVIKARPQSVARAEPSEILRSGGTGVTGSSADTGGATVRSSRPVAEEAPITASTTAMEETPDAPRRRSAVTAAAVGAALLLSTLAGFWLFKPEGKMTVLSSGAPELSTEPPGAKPVVAAPLPPSPQAAPYSPPAPQSPVDALALILEKRSPELKVGVELQGETLARGVRTPGVTYTSSEAGLLYVIGRHPARNDLQLLAPASNSPAARADTAGKLQLAGDALTPGTWELVLIVARQPPDLVALGWTAEAAVWKRRFGADASQDARQVHPWRYPECPLSVANCSTGYGATAFALEVKAAPVEAVKQRPTPPIEAGATAPRASPPAPRVEVAGGQKSPSAAKPPPNPECEKILMRMSLGETGQELIDRMKTLKCN
jgi:serine/threonine protein kinase